MSISFDYTTFRTNLRRLIDSRGFNIKSFSEEIGMTSATLSRYLSGDRTPDLPYVVKLAAYFQVSIDWLLGISNDRYNSIPDDLRAITNLYSLATPDDRKVVHAVLDKYAE